MKRGLKLMEEFQRNEQIQNLTGPYKSIFDGVERMVLAYCGIFDARAVEADINDTFPFSCSFMVDVKDDVFSIKQLLKFANIILKFSPAFISPTFSMPVDVAVTRVGRRKRLSFSACLKQEEDLSDE